MSKNKVSEDDKVLIRQLVHTDISFREIASRFNISNALVSYYASKEGIDRGIAIGKSKMSDLKLDYDEVQRFINSGASKSATKERFGIWESALERLISTGVLRFNMNASQSKMDLEELISQSKDRMTTPHERRLIKNKMCIALSIKGCQMCSHHEWLGKPILLELDHINGDAKDNRLDNYRLICPNCHSTTPTYKGRNRRSKKKKHN